MKRSEERKKNVGNRKDIHSLISVSIHVCMSKKGKKRSVDYIILFEAISCPTNRVKKIFFRKIMCRLRKKKRQSDWIRSMCSSRISKISGNEMNKKIKI
jgi:hypothetical protein